MASEMRKGVEVTTSYADDKGTGNEAGIKLCSIDR